MATDNVLDALGAAVEHKICGVNRCTAEPVCTRNGRYLCAHHRDAYDHGVFGEPCERCGSRQWIRTPDATSVATCWQCDFVTHDESVIKNSW
jgi:hypothetical protein